MNSKRFDLLKRQVLILNRKVNLLKQKYNLKKKSDEFFEHHMEGMSLYLSNIRRDLIDEVCLDSLNGVGNLAHVSEPKVENFQIIREEHGEDFEYEEFMRTLRQRKEDSVLEAQKESLEKIINKKFEDFIDDIADPTNIYKVKILTIDNIKTIAFHIFAQLSDQILLKKYVDGGLLGIKSLTKKRGRPRKRRSTLFVEKKRGRGRPRKGLKEEEQEDLKAFVSNRFDRESFIIVSEFVEEFKKRRLQTKQLKQKAVEEEGEEEED